MESCWCVLDSIALRLQNFLGTAPVPYNTGLDTLNGTVLQVWKILRDRVVLPDLMKARLVPLVLISDDLLVSWGITRISGMESFLATTWNRDGGYNWESDNASVCSINWVFAGVSLGHSLPNLILKNNGDIKKLHCLAKRQDLELWFEDECHFQQHGSRCVMWIPQEDTDPIVLHAPTRKSIGIYGAVCISDGRLVTTKENKFNALTFQSFLKHLVKHHNDNKKMVVILDNARWHHAKLLKPWLLDHQDILQLDFLPPYSPELNSIERVWKLTRKLCTHNRYFPVLEELVEVVSNQFDCWLNPNETLKRLCAIN